MKATQNAFISFFVQILRVGWSTYATVKNICSPFFCGVSSIADLSPGSNILLWLMVCTYPVTSPSGTLTPSSSCAMVCILFAPALGPLPFSFPYRLSKSPLCNLSPNPGCAGGLAGNMPFSPDGEFSVRLDCCCGGNTCCGMGGGDNCVLTCKFALDFLICVLIVPVMTGGPRYLGFSSSG